MDERSSKSTPSDRDRDLDLGEAKQAIAAARQQTVARCGEELNELLQRHNCRLVSYQEWVNGMPKGAAQIIVVANE